MQKKKFVVPLVISILSIFIFALPKQVHADMDGSVVVTPETFEKFFKTEGVARWDPNTAIIQLTENKTSQDGQFGSFHLRDRIAANTNFTLEGQIYLGDKTDAKGGGDGVGFAFYPGKVGSLGFTGGALGILGIPNAIGFRIDTFYNKGNKPNPGGITDIGRLGMDNDWPALSGETEGKAETPFGGFLTTNETGYGKNANETNLKLSTDTYLNENAGPVPIVFNYDGTTLTVTLNNDPATSWSRKINSANSLAFHVSASSGQNYNEQSFTFEKFTFNPVKKMTVVENWVGDDEVVDARPTTTGFTVVKKIGDVVEEKTHYDVSSSETWTKIIDELPQYNSKGEEITYDIEPDRIPGYTSKAVKAPHTSEGGSNSDGSDNKGNTGDESWTITNTYDGALKLETVPEVLNWTGRTIPRPGTILSRDGANDMTIAVKDTRLKKNGTWAVDAKVLVYENKPNNNSKLFSLLWKNTETDEPVELDGQKVLDNTADSDGNTYSKTWSIDTGVLLKANDYIPIGEYKDNVTINWTLTSAADPESTPSQEEPSNQEEAANQEETPSQDVEGGEQ